MIKGIKALGMNMEAGKGNGMIYELNKEYIHDGDVECGKCGYHYFDSIIDVMYIYNLNESRLFECELNGDKFDHNDIIHCTNKIKLIREITKEEIIKCIEDNLDKLVNNKDIEIKLRIVKQGYCLDKLVNDEEWRVRREVAKQGYGLDKLVNDKHWFVRLNVARHGYGLDILINDKDCDVRLEVAKQGYGLDKLVNDGHEFVRKEALKQLELRNNKEN